MNGNMKESINDFKECLALNRLAFDTARAICRAGIREREVKEAILEAWRKKLGYDPEFSGDIVGGANSSRIEGDATDRVIKGGETLILDLQPNVNGVFADTTRTFFIGEPGAKVREAYNAACTALKETQGFIRAGVKAKEIYRKIQASLAGSGFFCPHHAGHRVGTGKMMEPEFVEGNETPVEKDTFVALEPGVYSRDFGIRIENNYLVTAGGCEELFGYPVDIKYFII